MIDRPAERRDLDALLDQLLPLAKDMLRKRVDLFPFGAVIKADGKMKLLAGSAGSRSGDPNEAQELMDRADNIANVTSIVGGCRRIGHA